jgi:hypothetical protein
MLIFLLFSTTIFAQERHYFFNYFSLEELILGEWELEKTIIEKPEMMRFGEIPKYYKFLSIQNNQITSVDCVEKRNRKGKTVHTHFYEIVSLENWRSKGLKLYKKKDKKSKKYRYNEILKIDKCDFNQLVISKIEKDNSKFGYSSYVQFVYKRKQTNKYTFSDFAGTWYYFGDKSLNLGEHNSNEPIRLSQKFDTLEINNFQMEGSLIFYFGTLKNQITEEGQTNRYRKHISLFIREDGTFYTAQTGVYLKANPYINFWIDFKNQLLYLLHDTISVYHFNFDDEGALILTWDMERTKNLKKIER